MNGTSTPQNGASPVHIVTDSFAHFASAGALAGLPVTVVPNLITIAGRRYRESIDLHAEEALRLLAHQPNAPTLTPPGIADYAQVYSRLAPAHRLILSIHASREMFESWHNARAAAQQIMGQCAIIVIDSRTLSAGQGLLVLLAARAVQAGQSPDEVVRLVRGAIERVYSIFYTEHMEYLIQQQVIEPAHAILGTMLGVKPVLTIENGKLTAMEKVKTRVQAVERLVEFAVEFMEMEDAVILQHRPGHSESTRMLQDRLAVEFPDRKFPAMLYGPSLAALIGTEATGLVVIEQPLSAPNAEDHDDDPS